MSDWLDEEISRQRSMFIKEYVEYILRGGVTRETFEWSLRRYPSSGEQLRLDMDFKQKTEKTTIYKMENQEQKQELSFGQKLVGLTFNPSQDDKVGKVKALFAEIADILNDSVYDSNEMIDGVSFFAYNLYNHAVGEILNAQMNVVKVLTLKH